MLSATKGECQLLQIATGMYFKGVETYETTHRRVFFSNGVRTRADNVELVVGTLQFSTELADVQGLQIAAVDRLPKYREDGSESIHIATNGADLIQDVATVAAFVLDVTITSDFDLARRLIRKPGGLRRDRSLFRRVHDPSVVISDEEVTRLERFMEELVGLERQRFEASIRAIRRVVNACEMAQTDAALAYTLFVAALESLASETNAAAVSWDQYDGAKRKRVDAALAGASEDIAAPVRAAVLENDALGLGRKFRQFVQDNVSPSYYRGEAVGVAHPIRSVDLSKALESAYIVRSKSVHEVRELRPELTAFPGVDDTTLDQGRWVLTLEGLHRLCRHVIFNYVSNALKRVDDSFDYRSALPGVIQMRWAPQYWIGFYSDFGEEAGPSIFSALLDMVIAAKREEQDSITDMAVPLARIEQLLPATSLPAARVPLLATYLLWNEISPDDYKRHDAQAVIAKFKEDFDVPGLEGLVLAVMLERPCPWSTSEIASILDSRWEALSKKKVRQELPSRLDSALQLFLARRLSEEEQHDAAWACISRAVELGPGDAVLLALENGKDLAALHSFELVQYVVGAEGQSEGDS